VASTGMVSPYVGGRPFLAADSARFFGRTAQAGDLAARWRGSRLTILSSAAGAGRTSLLRAGVMPLLAREGTDVLPVGRVYRGTAFPVAALAEYNPHTLALLSHWSPGEPETQLSGVTVHDFLRKRPAKYDGFGRPLPVLAAIDQVEDLFMAAERDTAAFIGELGGALAELPQMRLLLSVPDDYLSSLAPHIERLTRSLAGDPDYFRLPPLSEAAALEAVRLPSAAAGRPLDPDAALSLVAAVRVTAGAVLVAGPGPEGEPAPAAEPAPGTRSSPEEDPAGAEDAGHGAAVDPWVLQVACAGLWDALPTDVTEVSERHVAGYSLGRALESVCADAVAVVAAGHGLPAADLAVWLPDTFLAGQAGSYRRRLVAEGGRQTAGLPNAVLRELRAAHLLAATWRAGARWYALRHDILAVPVARLARWAPGELAARFADTPAAFLRAAETAMAEGDLELAQRHAAAALRGARGNDLRLCGTAESLLGNAAYLRGDLAHAEERYRAATETFEALQDTRAVAGLLAAVGKSLLAQGRHGAAIEHLHSAVGRIPNDLTVQTELAWALWQAGQQRAALDVLTSVLAIDGGAPDALRARGEILADMGDAEGALRDLDRVRRAESPSALAAHGLAIAMLRGSGAGQDPDAEQKIDAALSQAPDSGPVLVYAARAAALGQHPDVAADLARRAVNATGPAIPAHQRRQALDLLEGRRQRLQRWRIEVEVDPCARQGRPGVRVVAAERPHVPAHRVGMQPAGVVRLVISAQVRREVDRAPEGYRVILAEQGARPAQRVLAHHPCLMMITERGEVAGKVDRHAERVVMVRGKPSVEPAQGLLVDVPCARGTTHEPAQQSGATSAPMGNRMVISVRCLISGPGLRGEPESLVE
jgi:tetratricopeptide (TPR) repeat protein